MAVDNGVKKVVIVGGGLVGALSACFMAFRGYEVILFEKRNGKLALSHRGRKALRTIGLENKVLENAIPMKGRLLHDLQGGIKSVLYDPVSHQCIYSIGRNYLNSLLLTATERYPNVKLYFQHKLINVNLIEGKTTFLNLVSQKDILIEADLIIGADGAFSMVRRCMERIPLFQFSQKYIEHGYLELCVPERRGHLMVPNHLHICPRGEFMMIALPNKDGSWTVTLFMPYKIFESLDSGKKVLTFFEKKFPDSIEILGKEELIHDFFVKKPSALVSIKCHPFHMGNKVVLIGDAAHEMVPFYGQGMNAGFEDCSVLNQILDANNGDIEKSIRDFTLKRAPNAHAICNLAMYNYVEMRDLVTRPSYLLRKYFDTHLFMFLQNFWIPLYNSVSFSDIDYVTCIANREFQDKVIKVLMLALLAVFAVLIFRLF